MTTLVAALVVVAGSAGVPTTLTTGEAQETQDITTMTPIVDPIKGGKEPAADFGRGPRPADY